MRITINLLRVMRIFISDPRRKHWAYGLAKQTTIPRQTITDILLNLTEAGWLAVEHVRWVDALSPRAPRTLYRITELGIAETKKAMRSLKP